MPPYIWKILCLMKLKSQKLEPGTQNSTQISLLEGAYQLLPPRLCASRELELGVEAGLKPWHCSALGLQVSQVGILTAAPNARPH